MKILERAAALGLCLCLCLGLAACGRGGTEAPQASPAPQEGYSYIPSFTDISDESLPSLRPLYMGEEGFYAAGYIVTGEYVPQGAVKEYEGQYDLTEPVLYYLGYEGDIRPLEAYEPVAMPEDMEGLRDLRCSSSIYAAGLDEDGHLVLVEEQYLGWSQAAEDVSAADPSYYDSLCTESRVYIRSLDSATGEELSSFMPADPPKALESYSALVDGQGRCYLPLSGGGLWVLSSYGDDLGTIDFTGYVYDLCLMRDGSVGVLMWDDGAGLDLSLVDLQGLSLEGQNMDTYTINVLELYPGGGDYDFYYNGGSSFYGYSLEDGEAQRLFGWTDCDISSSSIAAVAPMADGSLNVLVYGDGEGFSAQLAKIEKVPSSQAPQREALTLAVMYLDYRLEQQIIDFNRSRDDVRIEVLDYSSYNNAQDGWDAGYTKLTTEIMAGNMPDLVSIGEYSPFRQLAAKGLLEDLYPYLDRDPELSREDFFPNVLSALEQDGGLYTACAGFSVMTLAGSPALVGDEPGWDFDQLQAALEKMPEGAQALGMAYDRETMLMVLLAVDMESYLDWDSKSCNFDSPQFIDLLELASGFPSQEELSKMELSQEDSDAYRIAQGQQLLALASFSSTDFIPYDYAQMFGGEVCFIGFPTGNGVGTAILPGESISMSAACKNKEAAWDFLRGILSQDYQAGSYLPTNTKAFEESLEKAMEVEYETDSLGNYLLDENGEKIPISYGAIHDGVTTTPIYATTPSQAQQLRQVVQDAQKLVDLDMTVIDMISQEAAPYFAGQKSAQEVAKLIQSKMSIYVSEQS